MQNLEEVRQNFQKNLEMVEQIVDIGSDVGHLSVQFLNDLRQSHEGMSGFYEYKRKLDRVIDQIGNIKDASQLKEKYEIIRNQAVVLIVENFESFLNDCVKVVVNNYPAIIDWPEKKKILPVNVDVLRYSLPTVGDLVVTSLKNEVSFQDLQATLRFFKEYMGIEFALKDEVLERIIFSHALRHIVVHNSSKVDYGFISQIRNTSFSKKYEDGQSILLSEEEYKEVYTVFLKFSEEIIAKLKKKSEEKYI